MLRRLTGVALVMLLAPAAGSLTVEGHSYEPNVTVGGQGVKLIGAGVRQKWFSDVYVMAAYTASGKREPSVMINADEPKYLRLDMLRDVAAEKMATTIGESFDKHMPADASPELKDQRAQFESYFKEDCTKGTVLEFIYVPGTGTIFKQNGKQLGAPLAGQAFSKVLWDIYFGELTCCIALKESILKGQ